MPRLIVCGKEGIVSEPHRFPSRRLLSISLAAATLTSAILAVVASSQRGQVTALSAALSPPKVLELFEKSQCGSLTDLLLVPCGSNFRDGEFVDELKRELGEHWAVSAGKFEGVYRIEADTSMPNVRFHTVYDVHVVREHHIWPWPLHWPYEFLRVRGKDLPGEVSAACERMVESARSCAEDLRHEECYELVSLVATQMAFARWDAPGEISRPIPVCSTGLGENDPYERQLSEERSTLRSKFRETLEKIRPRRD